MREQGEQKRIEIRLAVKNKGSVAGVANATVVGVQNAVEVSSMTIPVSDPPGNGVTRYELSFVPTMAGDILWTASIADGDPDVDEATRPSTVLPGDDDRKKRRR